jgi:Tfp pilus assembly protein PilO
MEKQWNELVEKIRQPKMVIILVLLLGILIDGSFYLYRILPQFLPMQNLTAQFDQLETRRIALGKTPIPLKIPAAEIERLIQQVPTSNHSARFLIDLIQIESQSGVEIESILNGAAANSNPVNSAASFAEQTMEVSILGTYAKLVDFINRVAGLPSFVNSKEWVFSDGSAIIAAGQNINPYLLSPDAANIQVKQRIKIKFTIYNANQFKNKFPDLPPISITEQPEKRLDPTIPDTRYYKLLDSLNQ